MDVWSDSVQEEQQERTQGRGVRGGWLRRLVGRRPAAAVLGDEQRPADWSRRLRALHGEAEALRKRMEFLL